MRHGLLALGLAIAACGSPAPAPAPAPAPSTSLSPSPSTSPSRSLSFSRLADRASHTDRVRAVAGDVAPESRIELRVTRGPTPASCDGDFAGARTLSAHDGEIVADVAPEDSATICVRDPFGMLAASATSPGFRRTPMAFAMWRDGRVLIDQRFEPLDDDVTAVVYVSLPPSEDETAPLPRLGCRVTASSGPNDDPPEVCEYDCAGQHVLAEVPVARWNAVLDSPSYHDDPDEGDEMLYPPTLGVGIPVVVPDGHLVAACVRTRAGTLVTTDTMPHSVAEAPWDGCAFETVAGCLGTPSAFGELERGDVLLGLTDDGTIVRATVASTDERTQHGRDLITARGVLTVVDTARVRTDGGTDVLAGDIAPGARLWSRYGVATVSRIEVHEYDGEETSVDLQGATYFLSSGFAVRDDGGPEPTWAPAHREETLHLEGGDGDCVLQASWSAASTSDGVVVHVAAGPAHDTHAPREGSCTGAIASAPIDARTLAAIAAIAPDAEIQLQLYGSAIECSTDYWVSRCDAADAHPIGPALSWVTTPQCLPEGTPIDTPRGRIAIEKLERGDEVLSWDPVRGLGVARVLGSTTHRDRPTMSVTLDDGTVLVATPDHVVMAGSPPRETAMSALAVGDVVSVRRDETVVRAHVLARGTQRPRETVVELRVTAPDTYFASGVLVHNY